MLSDVQIERYSRQILIPEIGGRGQEKLLAASVAIHGRTEVAATAATYLAAAGIGRLALSSRERTLPGDENPDTQLIDWDTTAPQTACAQLPVGCTVVLVTGRSQELLDAVCGWGRARGQTVAWGDDAGEYALLGHPSDPDVRICAICVQAPKATRQTRVGADPARTAAVGTQLATLAIGAILDWHLPAVGQVFEYDESHGARPTRSSTHGDADCPHPTPARVPADRRPGG